MRALAGRQATRCESAKNKRCGCRCAGVLHGARRALTPDPGFFEQLPEEDPHHVYSAAEKKQRAKIKRQQTKAPLQIRMWEELT